jgi:hypothetical protein
MKLFSMYLGSRTAYPAVLMIGTGVSIAALVWGVMGFNESHGVRTDKGMIAETSDDPPMRASGPSGSADASGVQTAPNEARMAASVKWTAPLLIANGVDSDAGSEQASFNAGPLLSMNASRSAANQGVTEITGSDLVPASTPERGLGLRSASGFGANGSSPVAAGTGGASMPIASMGWEGGAGQAGTTGSPASAGSDSGAQPSSTAGAAPGPGMEEVIASLSPDVAHFPSASIPGSGMPVGSDGVDGTTDNSGNRDMSVDVPLAPPKLAGGGNPIEPAESVTPANPLSQEPSSLLKPDVGIIDNEKIDVIELVKTEPADLGTPKDELTRPDSNPGTSRLLLSDVRQQTVDEPPAGLAIGLGVLFFALRRGPRRRFIRMW